MKEQIESVENNDVIKPEMGFVRDCVMDLKKTGRCYAYQKWQVEEIQKLYKQRYKKDTICRETEWYYIIEICNLKNM